MKKSFSYVPLFVLLLLAGTLMFSVVLLPLLLISEDKPAPIFIIFALIVVITTVASLVSLVFYITFAGK